MYHSFRLRPFLTRAACLSILLAFFAMPSAKAEDPSSEAVTVGSHSWASKKIFAAMHGRCGVRHVSEFETNRLGQVSEQIDYMRSRVAQMLGKRTAPTTTSGLPEGTIIVIPVYFHVLAYGSGTYAGEVTATKLFEQIDVLNRAYDGTSGGPSTPFRFEIADISYTYRATWAAISWGAPLEYEVKRSLRQGNARTLNVYLASLNEESLGWSTFPWEYSLDPSMDGVVINHLTLPGGGAAPYDEGDTLVHEVGHWLGLLHTFENGCKKSGDGISDTPAERNPSLGCPKHRNSCRSKPGRDPVSNYMDYTDDACMRKFTPRQIRRMSNFWMLYRASQE